MAASCGAVDCPYLRQKGTSSLQTSVDGQKGDIAGYVTQSGGGHTAGQCV